MSSSTQFLATAERFCLAERGTDGSRGLQPTVAEAKSLRRGATLERRDGQIQASLRDAKPMKPFSVG